MQLVHTVMTVVFISLIALGFIGLLSAYLAINSPLYYWRGVQRGWLRVTAVSFNSLALGLVAYHFDLYITDRLTVLWYILLLGAALVCVGAARWVTTRHYVAETSTTAR